MFRRKDELDLDGDVDTQGSLLGNTEPDTVNVLSPEKAAEYNAGKQGGQSSNRSAVAAPASAASASQGFGQTARPIPAPTAPAADASRPAGIASGSSNPYHSAASAGKSAPRSAPAADSPRFRAPQAERQTPPPAATPPAATTPSAPTSNYSESPAMMNKHNQNERILTVGNEILLKGEITACDRLVIEGNVDATVSEVTTIVLSESGSFKGTAEVEFAEISGEFDGDLTVRGSLVVHRTGRINGSVSYGEIEIARGGAITGEIKTIAVPSATSSKKEEKEEKVAA